MHGLFGKFRVNYSKGFSVLLPVNRFFTGKRGEQVVKTIIYYLSTYRQVYMKVVASHWIQTTVLGVRPFFPFNSHFDTAII